MLFIASIFGSEFLPHATCYLRDENLILLHTISDSLIGIAYMFIPFALIDFRRSRPDVPFNWMFLAFGTFIVACGLTHFMEILTVWEPLYWEAGGVKALTAIASIVTAIALRRVMPLAIALPSPDELKKVNATLQLQIEERMKAEEILRQTLTNLEATIQERTRELSERNIMLQEAMHAAEMANKTKDQFIAVLSHELRTPLTPVATTLELLLDDPEMPEAWRPMLELMRRNVAMEKRLINDLLDTVAIQRGKLTIARVPVELGSVIEQVSTQFAPMAKERGLLFTCELTKEPLSVIGDPLRLEQTVSNLLQNALKFTDPGKNITMSVTRDGMDAVIVVTDEGIGFDKDREHMLFNPFEQAEKSINRRFGGLGLGLAITKNLVEFHGGTVTAFSAGEGQGATFTIRLPLVE